MTTDNLRPTTDDTDPANDELALRDQWMSEAKGQTLDTLPAFLRKLADHPHDYGTICRAIAAGAVAAANALDKDAKHGGITGFQAGCVMWDIIIGWGVVSEGDMPTLRKYADLLYPQYDYKWHVLSSETWAELQKKARDLLRSQGNSPHVHPAVLARWQEVADGRVPAGFTVAAPTGVVSKKPDLPPSDDDVYIEEEYCSLCGRLEREHAIDDRGDYVCPPRRGLRGTYYGDE